MEAGNLVRFKNRYFHQAYGIGVILGPSGLDPFEDDIRYLALFQDERIMVRFNELELINESW